MKPKKKTGIANTCKSSAETDNSDEVTKRELLIFYPYILILVYI